VNSDVVSQGIVLLSVLSGFAFVIAAEVALRDPFPEDMQRVAYLFFATGLYCVLTVALGVLYFVQGMGPGWTQGLSFAFAVSFPGSVLVFVLSLVHLFRLRFSGGVRRDLFTWLGIMALTILGLAVAIVSLARAG